MEPNEMNTLTRAEEILQIIQSGKTDEEIRDALDDYHENDIAEALQELDTEGRKKLYRILGVERVSEIFTYIDDVSEYLEELPLEQAADVLENMDADDAVDALEDLDDEEQKQKLISMMDEDPPRIQAGPVLRGGRDRQHDDHELRDDPGTLYDQGSHAVCGQAGASQR